MIVVIDDERILSGENIHHARTSSDGLKLLKEYEGQVVTLYLDHDLGWNDTIMPVVDYLCERAHFENPYPVQNIVVHSMNPTAALNIMRALRKYPYNTRRVPAHLVAEMKG